MYSNKYKTEICKTFKKNGSCPYRKNCQYAHGNIELRPVQPKKSYKTVICNNFFKKGFCPYGDRCNFAHDQAYTNKNKSLNNHNYKTKICKFFEEKDTCPYGNKCIFIHKPKIIRNNLKNKKYNLFNNSKINELNQINQVNELINDNLEIERKDSNEIYKKESRLFNVWLRKN